MVYIHGCADDLQYEAKNLPMEIFFHFSTSSAGIYMYIRRRRHVNEVRVQDDGIDELDIHSPSFS